VNWSNDVPDLSKSKSEPTSDIDGEQTLKYIRSVKDAIDLITGDQPKSMGLHPLIYFYTRGGEFQPNALIATAAFLRERVQKDELKKFTRVRARIESFLLTHKEFVTLIIKKTGAGRRSLGRITRYLDLLMKEFAAGKADAEVLKTLENDPEFGFLPAMLKVPPTRDGENPSRRFNRATKSASYVEAAMQSAVKCGICGGLVHRNAMQFDHKVRARDGGGADMSNARVAHPYCNSARDSLERGLGGTIFRNRTRPDQ
jgi:hypothetical protein